MYVQLYINGRLKLHWHFEDSQGALVDQLGTETRRSEWNSIVNQCWEQVREKYGDAYESIEMAVQVRSRMRATDLEEEDYKKFTVDVNNRQVNRIVGMNKPKMIGNKLL